MQGSYQCTIASRSAKLTHSNYNAIEVEKYEKYSIYYVTERDLSGIKTNAS